MAVGIDAHRWQPSAETLLQLVYQPEDIVQAVGGLPIAAEDDLPVGADVPAEEAVQSLPGGWVPAPATGSPLYRWSLFFTMAQTELTVAVALVGEVDVQRSSYS